MKKHIARIALFSLVAAALVAVPATSRADGDSTTDKSAAAAMPALKKKSKARTTFHGSVAAVDTAAMTLTVDTNTLYVTSATMITKDGKPATLSEITVGETAKGTFKTGDDGKMDATTVTAGEKAPKKPRKKASTTAPATPARQRLAHPQLPCRRPRQIDRAGGLTFKRRMATSAFFIFSATSSSCAWAAGRLPAGYTAQRAIGCGRPPAPS